MSELVQDPNRYANHAMARDVGALIERVALRPLVGRPVFVSIIITLFVGALLRTGLILGFGAGAMPLATPWDPMGSIEFAGAGLSYSSAAIIGMRAARSSWLVAACKPNRPVSENAQWKL